MKKYYLNIQVQSNGDYEVHTEDCRFLPKEEKRIYLGSFAHCKPAIEKAKGIHSKAQINGCYFCSNDCHTS